MDTNKVSELTKDIVYPDYMEKAQNKSFKSQTAIGKIWRQAQQQQQAWSTSGASHQLDSTLLLANRSRWRDKARQLVSIYATELLRLMSRFGAFDEGEVMTGRVARFHHGPHVCSRCCLYVLQGHRDLWPTPTQLSCLSSKHVAIMGCLARGPEASS